MHGETMKNTDTVFHRNQHFGVYIHMAISYVMYHPNAAMSVGINYYHKLWMYVTVNVRSNMDMTITSDVQQVRHGTKTVAYCNNIPKSDKLSTVTKVGIVIIT